MSISDIAFLETLEATIQQRQRDPDIESYTSSLFRSGRKRIAQKVGEEAVELALAATSGDRDEVLDESADLFYHVLVLLAARGIQLKDVCTCLRSRHTS